MPSSPACCGLPHAPTHCHHQPPLSSAPVTPEDPGVVLGGGVPSCGLCRRHSPANSAPLPQKPSSCRVRFAGLHRLPDASPSVSVAAVTRRRTAGGFQHHGRATLTGVVHERDTGLAGRKRRSARPRSFTEGEATRRSVPLPSAAAGGHPRRGLLPLAPPSEAAMGHHGYLAAVCPACVSHFWGCW